MIPQGVAASPDDAALARRIVQSDEHAFVALMRRHNRMLYRLARSILKDDADAEETVQEAYLAAYRNMASFRGGSRLSTWLGRIVINEAYARLQRQKKAAVVVPFASAERGGQRMEDDMADEKAERPDAAAMRTEVRCVRRRGHRGPLRAGAPKPTDGPHCAHLTDGLSSDPIVGGANLRPR